MLVEYIESEADRQSVLLEVRRVNRLALDALRVENERLRNERPLSDDELKRGQELIRNQPPDWILPRLVARAHRAEAENERLRAALRAHHERMAEGTYCGQCEMLGRDMGIKGAPRGW